MVQQGAGTTGDARRDEAKAPLPAGDESNWVNDLNEERIETPDFSEIIFPDEPSVWRPTPNPRPLIEILQRERLIILAGAFPDKLFLARRCGYEMAKYQTDHMEGAPRIRAMQLRETSRAEDVFSSVGDTQAPTVFVFPRIDPAKINRNIPALHGEVRDNHWLIISTDRTREAWQLPERFGGIWLEPNERELYHAGDLTKYFHQTLTEKAKGYLSPYGDASTVFPNIAAALGSPGAIEVFARALAASDNGEFDLKELVKTARNDDFAIETWFRYALTPREQMIAIALSLFDGLEEDVALAAVERLMENAWRRRDATLTFIDYGDIINLKQYFEFEQQSSGAARLRVLGEATQATILRTAWKTHRRQIGAALPELARLVMESAGELSLGFHLQEREKRLRALRESIARSLGQVALLSLDDVEPPLLDMVMSGESHAHQAVAGALHFYRMQGDEARLFEMLARWRNDAAIRSLLRAIIGDSNGGFAEQRIGRAIATIIGQLAIEDPPNAVSPEIVRLAQAYTNSGDTMIVGQLARDTVPTLVNSHTHQMIELSSEFLNRVGDNWRHAEFLTFGFGFGIARALRAQQRGLTQVLSQWITNGLSASKKGVDESKISLREKQLAVAIHAISFSRSGRSERGSRGITPIDAMDLLTKILAAERHPFVRAAGMTAVRKLIHFEYLNVADTLSGLLPHLTSNEVDRLVAFMVDQHCFQRSEQSGGDALVQVGNYSCPIWYDKPPENTQVQNTVFSWVNRAPSAEAASFAGRVVLEIRAAIERSQEQEQSRLVKQREADEKRRKEVEEASGIELARHSLQLGLLDRFVVVPLATADRPASANAVAGLLETVRRMSRSEGEEVLDRIRQEGKQSAIVANLTARAWWISRNLTRLGVGLLVILFILFVQVLR